MPRGGEMTICQLSTDPGDLMIAIATLETTRGNNTYSSARLAFLRCTSLAGCCLEATADQWQVCILLV